MKSSNELLRNISNTIRGLSMDAVQKANSGHPGLPMGMSDVMSVLWSEFLQFNPKDPTWPNRDRFVLSGGHGSMLIYSALHLYGYDVSLNDIKAFRQWHSKTPGHPEYRDTPGIETTTGPLGQGVANAVGMAIAESSLAGRYNSSIHQIVDHTTYVMCGDGDLEEGISHEVCSLAGHLKLDKLILLYDSNDITIDGSTDLSFSDNTNLRFKSYGWNVIEIDGHNMDEIRSSLQIAKEQSDAPTIIICKTTIGFGSPNKAGTSGVHGSPLGVDELKLTKENLGISHEDFYISEGIAAIKTNFVEQGKVLQSKWNQLYTNYKSENAELASKYEDCMSLHVPENCISSSPIVSDKAMATRSASGKVLEKIEPQIESLFGGSADLTPSNKTLVSSQAIYSAKNRSGTYMHYGVREHGMTAIMNGMTLHGGFIPYSGTFFAFADYMRPAMRMAALMKIQSIYVFTHDSIGLGEDGPTHQPISHLASLRAMPNINVIRPMDANETKYAWKVALATTDAPSCLVLSRQNLTIPDRTSTEYNSAEGLLKGGYVLTEDEGFDTIIIATGSEVGIAMDSKSLLNEDGIKVRIVSMPCTDIFDMQDELYQQEMLPNSCSKKIVIEAGATYGWHKYVGENGKIIGLDHYGASAPFEELYEQFGISAKAVVKAAKSF